MVLVGHPPEHTLVHQAVEPLGEDVPCDPEASLKASKRVTPRKASRRMRRLHHSPTTSRHWATEQFMSSNLVRCIQPEYRVACCNAHHYGGFMVDRRRSRISNVPGDDQKRRSS